MREQWKLSIVSGCGDIKTEIQSNQQYFMIYFHSPVDEAALSFQARFVDKHDTLSEVLNPSRITYITLLKLLLKNGCAETFKTHFYNSTSYYNIFI